MSTFTPNVTSETFLDQYRAEERAFVHFESKVENLDGLVRLCTQVDSVDQLTKIIDNVDSIAERNGGKVRRVVNRFAVPSPLGFRDFRLELSLEDTQVPMCFRVVASQMYEATFATLRPMAEIVEIAAKMTLKKRNYQGPFVVVIDNFTRDEYESLTMIYGFLNHAHAKHYAITRMCDSLRTLHANFENMESLRIAWSQSGEDVVVGNTEDPQKFYVGSDELWEHIICSASGFGHKWDPMENNPDICVSEVTDYYKYLEYLGESHEE